MITMKSLISGVLMASITIRSLDEGLKNRLRIRAAHHQRSMEDEVRHILKAALTDQAEESADLGEAIQRRFQSLGGVNLELEPRAAIREPPTIET
jgi:plasmid stability protein